MAGTARPFAGLTMGGPRFRSALTTDAANAGYPDLLTVPAGARVMAVRPATNALLVQDEDVDGSTSLSASLIPGGKGGTATADQWSAFPVAGGSIMAIYGATAGTVYEVAFYERGAAAP